MTLRRIVYIPVLVSLLCAVSLIVGAGRFSIQAPTGISTVVACGDELIGVSEGGCSSSCTGGCEDLNGYYYNCYQDTCAGGGGGGGGGGGSCNPGTVDVGCPTGFTGSDIVTTSADCSTTEQYSCVPQVCPNGPDGSSFCPCPTDTSWNGSSCVSGPSACTEPEPTCQSIGASCGIQHAWWCLSDPTNSQYVTLDCGDCNCVQGEYLDVNQDPPRCRPLSESCGPNQQWNNDLQRCYDVGGSCPDTVEWGDCGTNGTTYITYGYPPAGAQYSQIVTYSWVYPYCGYVMSGVSIDTNGNCPVVDTTSVIYVNSNTSGSWTISPGGLSGEGNDGVEVHPSSSGTIYTFTPASVPGYSYPPSVTNSKTGVGSSMLLFQQETATFTVTYASAFNYSLSNSGNTTIIKGGRDNYGQTTITKTLTSGSTQSVDLTVSGVPSNVEYQMANTTCSPNCTSTITFTVHPTATAGTYPITVTGTGGKTTSFNLVVQNSPDIVVMCSATPSPALVGQNVTWNANVTGGVPPYTFVWSGTNVPSPAPTTQSFTTTYSTVGAKTAQLHVTDSLSNVGVCNPVGTVQVNFNPQFKEF